MKLRKRILGIVICGTLAVGNIATVSAKDVVMTPTVNLEGEGEVTNKSDGSQIDNATEDEVLKDKEEGYLETPEEEVTDEDKARPEEPEDNPTKNSDTNEIEKEETEEKEELQISEVENSDGESSEEKDEKRVSQ